MASDQWEENQYQIYCPISGLAGVGMLWQCLDPWLASSPHGEGKLVIPSALKAAQGAAVFHGGLRVQHGPYFYSRRALWGCQDPFFSREEEPWLSDSLSVPVAGHDVLCPHHSGYWIHPRQPEDHSQRLTHWQVRTDTSWSLAASIAALWGDREQVLMLFLPYFLIWKMGELEPTSQGYFMGPASRHM